MKMNLGPGDLGGQSCGPPRLIK